MKRLTILISLAAVVVLLTTAHAFMQSGSRRQLGGRQNPQTGTTISNELPRTYLNQNRLHKFMITDKDRDAYDQFAKARAIRQEIDYGSYKLIVVDEEALGGRAALQALPVDPRDDQNLIILNGYLIDTGNRQPLSKELPADLKRSRMSAALAGNAAPGKGIYIVQFVGPTQDSWLKALEKTGAEVITYVPNHAYVVFADERAAGELIRMKAGSSFVQWLGDYEPGYKLRPELQIRRQLVESGAVRVTVQLIDNPEGRIKADQLRASARQYFGERRVLKYLNLTVMLPVSQLTELTRSDEVFAIEEDHKVTLLDEAQGQIVAGNLAGQAPGHTPSGPGYLDWLASKGFNGSQFNSFAIHVVDDEYSLRGHPDLPDSRIAFEHNLAGLTGPHNGHGFLNSQIIGGFNDGTGQAYEDANGFNYGLGIVPWARLGVTALLGCGGAFLPATPALWESPAYDRGARISSNSWGGGFGYDTFAQEYDSIVRDTQKEVSGNQQMTVVFAAGNSGPSEDSIGSPGTAKNVMTVGASENVRPAGIDGCGVDSSEADSADDIASFSSRGPVNPGGGDGRVKPDIVAPGTHIEAGVPQSNYEGCSVCDQYFPLGQTLYGWSSGTSHSTPAVAGGAALVYQDFLNKGLEAPSPAMIKAVLMNSASYLAGAGAGDTLPSNNQGMGLMNLGRAFDGVPRLLIDQSRIFGSSGETSRITGSIVSSDQPFRVTLAWTDAPGSTIGAPWVNDLDLEVTINGQTYLGNVFSGSGSITGGTADGKNNVESIFLPAGLSGDFTVTVRAANIAGDGLPDNGDPTDQDFALVVYNGHANSPLIGINPASLSFTAAVNGNNLPTRTVNISNTGIGTLNWTASDDASWLSVSPAGGAASSTLTVSVNASGLGVGVYSGTITVSATNAPNSPFSVPVTLKVLPVFAVNPTNLSFTAVAGGRPPASQTINISNNDSSPRRWTASDDAPWLTLSPAGGTAASQLTATVNAGGLAVGTYNGTITIVPTNAPTSPISVTVTLTVLTAFVVSPTSLNFTAPIHGSDPYTQIIHISNNVSTLGNWTASDDAPWLTLSPSSGAAPSRLTAAVNLSGLSIGTYHGTITIRSAQGPALSIKVPVTLVVDRFANGGFEESASPWVMSGVATRSTGTSPRSGKAYLHLGGADRSSGSAYQEITIPRSSSLNLEFWLNVTSSDMTATANDKLFVEIRDPRGKLLITLATFSNLNNSAPGKYLSAGSYSLAGFAGQTVRIQFRTATDSSELTSFRIDDVSVK